MKYYMLDTNEQNSELYIFGDITSWPWLENDVSSYILSQQLAQLETDSITVHINSYGGEVAEGLAIYNTLRNHKAKITTVCEGFACSIASVIFMAGDERIMNESSLLMVHNPWTRISGNSKELRKEADDLDVISQATLAAYTSGINIDGETLQQMLDTETWILPADAVDMGFATGIKTDNSVGNGKAAASANKTLINVFAQLKESQTQKAKDELANKQNKLNKFMSAICAGKVNN